MQAITGIPAVVAGVLGHQLDLAHAALRQAADLLHHLGRRPAAQLAPDQGDAAEGARLVAALADLDEGHVGGGQQGPAHEALVAGFHGGHGEPVGEPGQGGRHHLGAADAHLTTAAAAWFAGVMARLALDVLAVPARVDASDP